MKAVTYDRFGDLDVLQLSEVAAPQLRAGQLLVRVHAVSINPLDAKIRRGQVRLLSGARFPKRPGCDFAGVVEAVGPGVVGFAVGERVFGALGTMRDGSLAERIAVPARVVARIPAGLDFVGAAAAAVVGLAALQALRDVARVKAGDRVLVHGATGGVGLLALQLARQLGARVTAVAGAGLDVAREFGADEALDYRRAPITSSGLEFDAVLDLSTRLSFAAARPLLAERGVFVGFEPSPGGLIAAALLNPLRGRKHRFVISEPEPADLDELARRLASGALRPAPVQVFELAEFRRAFAVAEQRGTVGKVVVRLA